MLTEEEKRERHKIAKAKYDSLRTTQFVFRLRLNQDADVIDKLKSVSSKTEYLRTLVRRDINAGEDVL